MKKNQIEGVVVKVTESYFVLLCDDGAIKNIPRNNEEVPLLGKRLTYTNKSQSSLLPFKYISVISMAAILFLTLVTYGFIQKGSEPHYVVAIDINPSIEMHINQDLKVLELSPLNIEGKSLVESIEEKDLDLYKMTEELITKAVSKGYLNQNEKGLVITTIVSLKDETSMPLDNQLKEIMEKQLDNHQILFDVHVFKEEKEFYDQAQLLGLSVNKFRLYNTLNKKGIYLEVTDIQAKSVRKLESMVLERDKTLPSQKEMEESATENKSNSKPVQDNPVILEIPKNDKEDIERHRQEQQNQQKKNSNSQENNKESPPKKSPDKPQETIDTTEEKQPKNNQPKNNQQPTNEKEETKETENPVNDKGSTQKPVQDHEPTVQQSQLNSGGSKEDKQGISRP